jgi:hypothetical protein
MESLLNANSSLLERLVFADATPPPIMVGVLLGLTYLYVGSLGVGCVTEVDTCVYIVTTLPFLYILELVMAVSVLQWGVETPLTIFKKNVPRILQ